LSLLAGMLLWAAGPLWAAQPDYRNVILIGWDGTQRNHLKEMIALGEVPNLTALCREGRLVDIDVTDGATDTKAGWAQILTGYRAETTGVCGNGSYRPIPPGLSVFERLKAHFGTAGIDTVAIIGKKQNIGADPPEEIPYETWLKKEEHARQVDQDQPGHGDLQGGEVVEKNGRKVVEVPGRPWYNAVHSIDVFVNGLRENDAVGRRAIAELKKRKDHRFFFFVHFAMPDHAGHIYGENSQEYTDGIASDDAWTGKIVAALKRLKIYDETLVLVTTDHGFDEGARGHRYAPYIFLGSNDPALSRDGDRLDIAPTILKRFGVDLRGIDPPLDGTPLDEPAVRRPAPPEDPGRT
jgi:hypothetical protein